MIKGGMASLMKQAQQMQEKMQKAQQELASSELIGSAGAGLIKITMSGKHDVTRVFIDSSLLSEEKEILEDLIAAAINDAVRKVEKNNQEKMSSITSGLQMPAGLKMPF